MLENGDKFVDIICLYFAYGITLFNFGALNIGLLWEYLRFFYWLSGYRWTRVVKIATFLAVFQGAMPLLGWWLGRGFQQYIQDYDHWVAFVLLLILGSKMIVEGRPKKDETCPCCFDPSKTRTLLGLSVATSIDALAVGISFAFLKVDMCLPTVIITGTTFTFSVLALNIGRYFGRKLKTGAEIFGGIILILIGVKILIEHLCA